MNAMYVQCAQKMMFVSRAFNIHATQKHILFASQCKGNHCANSFK